jgi:hypothetical protein
MQPEAGIGGQLQEDAARAPEAIASALDQPAALAELRAMLAELDVALGSARRLAELRGAAAQRAQAELAALRDRLPADDGSLTETTTPAAEAEPGSVAQEQIAALRRQMAGARALLAEVGRLAVGLAAIISSAVAGDDPRSAVAVAEANERAAVAEGRLRQALAERAQADGALARAQQGAELRRAAADAAEADAVALRAELAAREAALAELTEAAGSEAATVDELKAALAQRDVALASLRRLAELRGAAAQRAQAELAALRDHIAAGDTATTETAMPADAVALGSVVGFTGESAD